MQMDAVTGRGQVGGYLPPGATAVDEDRKVRVGMLLYISTDVFVAIFMFTTYIWLRDYNTSGRWWAPSVGTPSLLTSTVIMGVLIISALLYGAAQWASRAGIGWLLKWGLVGAGLLLLFDCAIQVWAMAQVPFGLQDGGFAQSFLLLSGYHVYHVVVGLILIVGVANAAFHGDYTREHTVGLDVTAVYWYWITLWEIGFWALVLIQPPNLR